MNFQIGTYFKVIDSKSAYYGKIGRYDYEICGLMMITFEVENGTQDGATYSISQLQVVA